MYNVSLTDFVDIVSKRGTPKATIVKNIKNRTDYHPAKDFYKLFRDHLIKTHKNGDDKKKLDMVMQMTANKTKLRNYAEIIHQYKRWWGRKNIKWFDPPYSSFVRGDIRIRINPELGLIINKKRYVIKLYFKSKKLSKTRIDLITHLMAKRLKKKAYKTCEMAVLDIRNKKLIPQKKLPMPMIDATINAEVAYISSLLEEI